MVAARVALEELHQRDRLITAEIEMFKVELFLFVHVLLTAIIQKTWVFLFAIPD